MPAKIINRWDEDLQVSPIAEMEALNHSFCNVMQILTPAMKKEKNQVLSEEQTRAYEKYEADLFKFREAMIAALDGISTMTQAAESSDILKEIYHHIESGDWTTENRSTITKRAGIARHTSMRALYILGCIKTYLGINLETIHAVSQVYDFMRPTLASTVTAQIVENFKGLEKKDCVQYSALKYASRYSTMLGRRTFNGTTMDRLLAHVNNLFTIVSNLYLTDRKISGLITKPYTANETRKTNKHHAEMMDLWKELFDKIVKADYDMTEKSVYSGLKKWCRKLYRSMGKEDQSVVFEDVARKLIHCDNGQFVFEILLTDYAYWVITEFGPDAAGVRHAYENGNEATINHVSRSMTRLMGNILQDIYNSLVKFAEPGNTNYKIITDIIGWKHISDPWSALIRPKLRIDMILNLIELGIDPMKNEGFLCRTIASLPPTTKIGNYGSPLGFIVAMFESGRADARDLPFMWINNTMKAQNNELLRYLVAPNPHNHNRPWVNPFGTDGMLFRDLLFYNDFETLKYIASVIPRDKMQSFVDELDEDAASPKYAKEMERFMHPLSKTDIEHIKKVMKIDDYTPTTVTDAYVLVLSRRNMLYKILDLCAA